MLVLEPLGDGADLVDVGYGQDRAPTFHDEIAQRIGDRGRPDEDHIDADVDVGRELRIDGPEVFGEGLGQPARGDEDDDVLQAIPPQRIDGILQNGPQAGLLRVHVARRGLGHGAAERSVDSHVEGLGADAALSPQGRSDDLDPGPVHQPGKLDD